MDLPEKLQGPEGNTWASRQAKYSWGCVAHPFLTKCLLRLELHGGNQPSISLEMYMIMEQFAVAKWEEQDFLPPYFGTNLLLQFICFVCLFNLIPHLLLVRAAARQLTY